MQQPLADSTSSPSYWLSWKVLLCLIIVVAPMILALFIIWKYEGEGQKQLNSDARETPQDVGFVLYDDNVWRPGLREIHPFWLLGFRVIAFGLALATFTVKIVGSRRTIFYYYTQRTFTLITFYFGYKCQMTVNMHTLNAILLLGDTALNSLRFSWFRIFYFIPWTGAYVIFQSVVHASDWIWWPYPFLDLSSPNAPLWYLLLGLMHLPCYGLFALVVKSKHYLLSKWFP